MTPKPLPPEWHCRFCNYGEYILEQPRAAKRQAEHEQFCQKNPNYDENCRTAEIFYAGLHMLAI